MQLMGIIINFAYQKFSLALPFRNEKQSLMNLAPGTSAESSSFRKLVDSWCKKFAIFNAEMELANSGQN